MTGKLFVFEGPDGVGKTTVTANIKQRLKIHPDLKVAFLRQPAKYRKEISETPPKNRLRMLYLFMKDREEQYPALKDLMASGYHIFMDRYYHSSCVYQSIGENPCDNPPNMMQIYEGHGDFIFKPEITFILDANDEVMERRLKERKSDDGIDNFEKNKYLRDQVRKQYRILNGGYHPAFNECVSVSNNGVINDSVDVIWGLLSEKLGLK